MCALHSTLDFILKLRRIPLPFALVGVAAASLSGQTTQGLISGSIVNSVTGRPISGASVTYTSATLAATGTLQSDDSGYYFLPLLSAGTYSIRATANGYQSQQLEQLELQVAGRIQIEFKLRPLSDVWEAGQYRSVFLPGSKTIVTFYGPDVDTSRSGSFEGQQGKRGTLDTSISYVIDPTQIGDLPLQGRDVYTMLVSLPGVNADNGTARGLGVSVAGQRPSSSNFLLDGVENNNYLVTGPLNPVAPEAVQEYRISTNNYSAEYGRTAGFVANAITRSGGKEYHGIGYEYLKNDVFNAADFQDNLAGLGRLPLRQNQYGYQLGGPVPKILTNRLFFSSALEKFRSFSSQAPVSYTVPSTNFLPALGIPQTRQAYQLLTKYPGPVVVTPNGSVTGQYVVAQPVEVDRLIALERGDFTPNGGKDHIAARLNIARLTEPDFLWSVYSQFIAPLKQHTTGGAGNWMHTWTPRLTSEFKLSYSDDDLFWNRAHPEVPILSVAISPDPTKPGLQLPGSAGYYDYKNQNKSFEAIYSTVWTRNRHVISAGAGALFRFNSSYFKLLTTGEYGFNDTFSFAFDRPSLWLVGIDAFSKTLQQPDSDRSYQYAQTYLFVQDSFRVNSRLTLNYGLRYENFGAPTNTGSVKDALLAFGPVGDFNSRLAAATIAPGSGNQQIYRSDNSDFAPRAGFTWDIFGKSKTLLRGGFGMFYDRPFDNLWQNVRINSILTPEFQIAGTTYNYLQPVPQQLPAFQNQYRDLSSSPSLVFMDPKLRNGYAETAFLGVQQSVGENLTIEVNGTASRGRRLITSDIVNRQFTNDVTADGRPNENLPDVEWRSSQGTSDYTALTALARYRVRTLQLQASYTWSHSLDQQSDPFGAEVVNLQFTTVGGSSNASFRSSFAQQFNNRADRGNSDFDQRQNLFLMGIWQSDFRRIALRGWQISWLAAFRTGFPYSVEAPQSDVIYGIAAIENQRADLLDPRSASYTTPPGAPGGKILLNPAAFGIPTGGLVGTSGRNAFRGPGLYNVDLSLARTFAVPSFWKMRVHEGTRLTLRADAFNVLNHANLNNPNELLGDPGFGLATYGRQGTASGFPAVSPVNETARQIQMMVRLEF